MFILPEEQVGIIVLTNVRNGAPTAYLPFNAVVKRRVVEAMFEGARPLAGVELDYYVTAKAKAVSGAVRSVQVVPDPDLVKRLAGKYTNASLGVLSLTLSAAGATLDAGEWNGAVGQRVGSDRALELVFLDPPFPGAAFTVGGDAAHPTLSVTDGQVTYVFALAPERQ